MAGRPRFLDALSPADRAVLEPELLRLIADGEAITPLLAWCQGKDIAVGRTALSEFVREKRAALSGDAEQAGRRVRREVEAAASKAASSKKPKEEEEDDEAPVDHATLLRVQLRAAERLSKEEDKPADRIAAAKLVLQLGRELREVERAGGAAGPQMHFYFPEKVRIEQTEEG